MTDADRQIALLPASALAATHTPRKGHAGRPGTGPEGERCGTCRHLTRTDDTARAYLKCGLTSGTWTRGPGSDIRAKDPACPSWGAKRPR